MTQLGESGHRWCLRRVLGWFACVFQECRLWIGEGRSFSFSFHTSFFQFLFVLDLSSFFFALRHMFVLELTSFPISCFLFLPNRTSLSHVVQIEYLNQHHKDLVSEIRQAMMSAKGTASNAEGSLGSMEASPAGASSSSSGGDSSGGSESSSRLGAGSAAAGAGGGGPGKNGAGGQSTNHSNASSAAAAAASAASGGGGAASGSVAGVVSDKNVAAVRPVVPGGKAEVDRPLILATIMPAGADPLPMTVRDY